MKKETKLALKDSLPVLAGYIVIGIGFGATMSSYGFGMFYSLLMSLCIYAGSLQYVLIPLMAAGSNLVTIAMMSLVVNIRHLFYGVAMLKDYQKIKRNRIYDIFALTDETFSILSSRKFDDDIDKDSYYFQLSLFTHSYWIIGTFLGSLLGNIIPFSTKGIEFSMTALFICVVIDQWEKTKDRRSTIGGFVISIICLVIFGKDSFLIPSMILIVIYLLIIGKVGKKDE